MVYKKTHKGVTYNQVFSHTMFVMAVTVSIVMMIIGSNIARAFSLVGALSIIRFRTAIKDSRDTGYIFASMATGMACGTGMYLVGATFSILFSLLMLGLNYFRVGEKIMVDKLLKVNSRNDDDADSKINTVIQKYVESAAIIHSEYNNTEAGVLYTYVISTEKDDRSFDLIKELQSISSVEKATIFYNDQRIEL